MAVQRICRLILDMLGGQTIAADKRSSATAASGADADERV